MTAPFLYTPTFAPVFNGQSVPGGKLYTYQAGTTNPKNTYTDAAATFPNTNPVILDSTGAATVRLEPGAYHFVLTDGTGSTTLWDQDYYTAPYLTAADVGALLYPRTAAETTANVTLASLAYPVDPVGDLRRYGLVPNSAGAAAANTTALKALWNPTGGVPGNFYSPNTTGADTYYFNDLIGIRDNVTLDLQGCTWQFTKTGVSGDSGGGFLTAIRNVTIQNGSISVAYTYTAGTNTGNAIMLGGRAGDNPLFAAIYDSLLSSPMGNITLRNLSISSNAGGSQARAIFSLGGVRNVVIENVKIDGQGALLNGIYCEFGWATNEANSYQRQTSHPTNWTIRNLEVKNVTLEGVTMNGGYNIEVDTLRVLTAGGVCGFGPGESLFYRPWTGNDATGGKHNIWLKNLVGGGITNLGVNVTGASSITSSYLNGPGANNPNGLTVANQTDLLDFVLDGFMLSGTSNNYGVSTSAGRSTIRNGQVIGFQHGINSTQEATRGILANVEVLNSTNIGVVLGQGVSIYGTPRQSIWKVEHCFIAGSGGPAISVGTTIECQIEHNRFGYETIHDNQSESTQTFAVTVAADAFNVICRENYVAGVASGNAYNLAAALSSSRGCTIISPAGISTSQGIWENTLLGQLSSDQGDASITYQAHSMPSVVQYLSNLTANRTVTLSTTNAVTGDRVRVVRIGLGSFTLAVGSLKTIPSATQAFVEAEFDGTVWRLIGYGTL